MKQTRQKNIFLIIAVITFVILLFNSSAVFAEINTSYSGTDTVPDTALEDAFSESSILNLLAKLIYAVGRFLEWILGTIFKLLTGSSDFPWADKIVFNAVPLLDVNFINPGGIINGENYATKTFVGQESIQAVLKNLYATILTLAAAFFGIVVLITAIKLVITTIASEKAKYKQAIVDWLVGFVMLFCIHYAISFIFYLNEQLVTVASKIVTTQLEKAEFEAVSVQSDSLALQVIENARASGAKYKGELVADILDRNLGTVSTWLNACKSEDSSKGVQEALMKEVHWWTFGADVAISKKDIYINLGRIIWWAEQPNISVDDLTKIKVKDYKIYNYVVTQEGQSDEHCITNCVNGLGDEWKDWSKMDAEIEKMEQEGLTYTGSEQEREACKRLCQDDLESAYRPDGLQRTYQALSTKDLKNIFKGQYGEFIDELKGTNAIGNMYYGTISSDGESVTATQEATNHFEVKVDAIDKSVENDNTFLLTDTGSVFYWSDFKKDLINLKKSSDTSSGQYVEGSGQAVRIISDLAAYFRYNSYSKELRTTNVAGMKNGDNIQIQNMIMYAILVAQSLILFISYVKRLFYVILLAIMAPIVVVFDFFQKFGK